MVVLLRGPEHHPRTGHRVANSAARAHHCAAGTRNAGVRCGPHQRPRQAHRWRQTRTVRQGRQARNGGLQDRRCHPDHRRSGAAVPRHHPGDRAPVPHRGHLGEPDAAPGCASARRLPRAGHPRPAGRDRRGPLVPTALVRADPATGRRRFPDPPTPERRGTGPGGVPGSGRARRAGTGRDPLGAAGDPRRAGGRCQRRPSVADLVEPR